MKLSDLKPGDRLIADDGFGCIDEDDVLEVLEDHAGLYVICRGDCIEADLCHHYLDGQEDKDGNLVGFKPAPQVRV